MTKKVTLAITGASGAPYAVRLLECLLAQDAQVALLISSAAEVVFQQEMGIRLPNGASEQEQFWRQRFAAQDRLRVYARDDWFAPVASGSSAPRSMVICPASGGTLSAIANGASNNLIERAADVALKERRQLIVVPRETPLSSVHLRNMLTLSELGAVVLPASPGFYYQPNGVEDLVDFVVARILDQLGLDQALMPRWGEVPET
jgi:4-hydroxy-3-polyprenylbenzoate decarboxylase